MTTSLETRVATSRRERILTLLVACAAIYVVMATMVSLNAALPEIAGSTGASQFELAWLVDGYTLALAALVLVGGWFSDRFGRRLMLVAGLAVFFAASFAPAISVDPTWLIWSRVVAGCAAACVLPSTLSMITATFNAEERARGVMIWAVTCVLAGGFGLVTTGFMLRWLSWESAFYLPAVLAGIALLLSPGAVESKAEAPPRFDLFGCALSAIAVGTLVLGVIEGPHRGWLDPFVLSSLGAFLVSAAAFARWEWAREEPLLDLRLFGSPRFAAGSLSLLVQFLVLYGLLFVGAQVLQSALGWDPAMSGVILASIAVPMIPVAMAASTVERRLGSRWCNGIAIALFVAGCLVVGSGFWELGTANLLAAIFLMGAAGGLATPTATSGIVESVSADQQGIASAVNDAVREVGAALGIALAGSLLAATYADRVASAAAQLPAPLAGATTDSLEGALAVAIQLGQPGDALAEAARQAFLDGAQTAFLWLGLVTLVLGAVLVLVSPGRNRLDR